MGGDDPTPRQRTFITKRRLKKKRRAHGDDEFSLVLVLHACEFAILEHYPASRLSLLGAEVKTTGEAAPRTFSFTVCAVDDRTFGRLQDSFAEALSEDAMLWQQAIGQSAKAWVSIGQRLRNCHSNYGISASLLSTLRELGLPLGIYNIVGTHPG